MSDSIEIGNLDFEGLLTREWLTANSLGSYSSSTICSLNTRRYHGLLVAAMSPPVRPMVLLSRVEDVVRCNGQEHELACNEYPGVVWPQGHQLLRAFSTEPFPRWAYQNDVWTLQKELRLLRDENTVLISYTLLGGTAGVDLEVRPLFALRGIHELCYQWNGSLVAQPRERGHWHVPATRRTPEIFFAHDGNFDGRSHWYLNQIYRREAEYGNAGLEDLWSPGAIHARLMPGQTFHFACSADPLDLPLSIERATRQLREPEPRLAASRTLAPLPSGLDNTRDSDPVLTALVKASADHLLASPNAEAFGVVGQYHWSPPSVRSALAGFTGLLLVPGRLGLARSMLATLAGRLVGGLLPTDFPNDGTEPQSRGADVSLWFIHAVRQYLLYSGDEMVVQRDLLPAVLCIIDAYRAGTLHGIGVDAEGLLVSGSTDTATTWMDHCVHGVPVTPRHGRPVEVNALWYNALMSAAELCRRFDRSADACALESLAARTRESFNRRFWNVAEQCCFDVVGDGGSDASIRPNQLFAISLPFAVLAPERWQAVVARARNDLLTPMGVRSLSQNDSRFIGRYTGPQPERDRAAHNGSVYPWLLGPLATAIVRSAGGDAATRLQAGKLLEPLIGFVRGEGLGHLFELADGAAPHTRGGAIASPLSVGELLRCYSEDVLGRAPRCTQASHNAVPAAGSTNAVLPA